MKGKYTSVKIFFFFLNDATVLQYCMFVDAFAELLTVREKPKRLFKGYSHPESRGP